VKSKRTYLRTRIPPLFAILLLASIGSARAHGSRALAPGSAGELRELLGVASFSATADLKEGATGSVPSAIRALYYYEPDKVRVEWDEAKYSGMFPGLLEDHRRRGIDLRIEITRFDQNRKYVIYPRRKAYYEFPIPPGDAFKVESGKDTIEKIDGHPCSQSRASVGPEVVVIWRATDLNQFPIQMETRHGEFVSALRFRDVRPLKASPSLFAPPPDFRKFDSFASLVRSTD